jgi:hypothetical protein
MYVFRHVCIRIAVDTILLARIHRLHSLQPCRRRAAAACAVARVELEPLQRPPPPRRYVERSGGDDNPFRAAAPVCDTSILVLVPGCSVCSGVFVLGAGCAGARAASAAAIAAWAASSAVSMAVRAAHMASPAASTAAGCRRRSRACARGSAPSVSAASVRGVFSHHKYGGGDGPRGDVASMLY